MPETASITGLRARPVIVPMARPLVTAGGAVTQAPLVLVDLETDAGAAGRAYSFAYHPWVLGPLKAMIDILGEKITGRPLDPPARQADLFAALRLVGARGVAGMALSALDMAAWDALGRLKGQPLCRMLGADAVTVPAYNSKGLGMIGAAKAAREAKELADEGFPAIKVRLGYPTLEEDVAVARAVVGAVPGVRVMSDYNQSQTADEVIRRVQALDDLGLDWVEEPVAYDDFKGHLALRARVNTPVQTGENCWFAADMEKALEAGACDLFMPDAGKIGGVTGWLAAAKVGAGYKVPLSSHLFPEVSVHLLAATPTRHWLEYVDWAAPVLQEPLPVTDGACRPPERPGIGMDWDEAAVARYAA